MAVVYAAGAVTTAVFLAIKAELYLASSREELDLGSAILLAILMVILAAAWPIVLPLEAIGAVREWRRRSASTSRTGSQPTIRFPVLDPYQR